MSKNERQSIKRVQRDCNNKFYRVKYLLFVEIRNYSFGQRNNILSNMEYFWNEKIYIKTICKKIKIIL